MQPTYSEIFAALGNLDPEAVDLLEAMVAQGSLPLLRDRHASELLSHARSIASRLEATRRLEAGETYPVAEFLAALRAEIAAKPVKTPICPVVLAAFEAHLALQGVETVAA